MTRVFISLALVLSFGGCGEAGGPAQAKSVAKPKRIGYDVRRLRPRDEEKLAAMFDRMRTQALGEGKQVAVLFSADWCEPCRALDLELGNLHDPADIGHVRILEIKEEDWTKVTRMNEFNELRRRWYAPLNSYPVFVLLDENGEKVEEMKDAIERLTAAGVEPTVPNWFKGVRS